MKKKSRRLKSADTSQKTLKIETTVSFSQGAKTPRNRGRPRKTLPVVTADHFHPYTSAMVDEKTECSVRDQKLTETKNKSSGRLSTATCRLCHGKFSPRSLRHAFNHGSRDSVDVVDEDSDTADRSPLLFHTDFQQLVGVQLTRDPQLSEFICKKCYANFYKCHGILIPVHWFFSALPSFTSDSRCLHSLVSWAHHHGEACRSCPDLKEVLKGQCWGSVEAVWGCVDGHSYTMHSQYSPTGPATAGSTLNCNSNSCGDAVMSEGEEQRAEAEGEKTTGASLTDAVMMQKQNSAVDQWTDGAADVTETLAPAEAHLEDRTADSDLSDRVFSEDEVEDGRKAVMSEDEPFDPNSTTRGHRINATNKRRQDTTITEEPRIKKKPGPKPGWKNKFKPKSEELPNIYKCPYQGCTAVYRAPDGLKKHIKEHHEEVRERPCPHPGCNKIFMIDRYLQRHVKLIHTEERNYICDQCGQTFKQRKHLSVHQMRHSGAKPLQCEVCGFQCRQRASLKYHMTKHKAEADLEFACVVCRKRFEKAHNLNVHMSMVHPVIQTVAQRGSNQWAAPNSQQQQQQQQQPPPTQLPPPYSEESAITLSTEVVQQHQDR
ncbi:zinc finger protein 276 [Cynoglossus semilaevis]|uniref:zinc finger protein 276 n=1 Tax=Cynoglossus semilaevis TaxID=244447 RepID=UPI000D62E51B|nr:zinc finger protein 276 [Cynoglossus semilaevis]